MRQLGERSPEPEVETLPDPEPQQQQAPEVAPLQPHEAQQRSPYSVEVHRVERQPVEPSRLEAPLPTPPPTAVKPSSTPPPSVAVKPVSVSALEESQELRITEARLEPNLASGRWEELGELPPLEPRRGSRINLEPMPWPPQTAQGLWTADQEPEHRSSFFAIGVTVVAAILAIGAIVWSGLLRQRMRDQNAAMSALQEQNHKLTDALEQEEKATDNPKPEQATAHAPAAGSPNAPANAAQPKTPPLAEQNSAQPLQEKQAQEKDAQKATPVGSAPGQVAQKAQRREGISVPPPVQSAGHGAVDPNYHPEIVPPYPTSSQPASPVSRTADQPTAQQYRGASSVNASNHSVVISTTSLRTPQTGNGLPPTANQSHSASSAPSYNTTSNASYANALAQNIETVQALQRQSAVPLREFHTRDGASAKVTPGLTVAMHSPDETLGTYTLGVNGVGTSYQLKGRINSPLALTDNVTHKSYQLLILHIAGGEAYGYLRPMQ
jgi:hypothetical protein